jgi:hypothetical protein
MTCISLIRCGTIIICVCAKEGGLRIAPRAARQAGVRLFIQLFRGTVRANRRVRPKALNARDSRAETSREQTPSTLSTSELPPLALSRGVVIGEEET